MMRERDRDRERETERETDRVIERLTRFGEHGKTNNSRDGHCSLYLGSPRV